jgi:hypothetical protein
VSLENHWHDWRHELGVENMRVIQGLIDTGTQGIIL